MNWFQMESNITGIYILDGDSYCKTLKLNKDFKETVLKNQKLFEVI